MKNEKDEGIAQKMASLANEDEVKHDKPEDEDTPSSKTEEDEVAAVEIEKSEDSPALEASAEDSVKHDKVEDAQSATSPPTDHKVEPAITIEKTEDSVPSVAVEDNVKEEKEVVPDSHSISDIEPVHKAPSTEPAAEETPPLELEKEPSNTDETSPLTESEGGVLKEAQVLETCAQVEEKPEPVSTPVAAEVDESQKEPEKQSLEQRVEEEKPDTSVVPQHSEESGDATEVKTRELEFEAEVLEKTNNSETEKPEPVEAEVAESQREAEKAEPVAAKVDEKQSETVKAEPVAAKVDENQSEPEKQEKEEKPKKVAPLTEAESAEQEGNIVEAHPPKDSGIEDVKDTGNSEPEAVPEKTEKPEPLPTEVEEKPREQLQVDEEVAEASKEMETKKEIVIETAKSEGTSDDTIKEEKTEKEEETSLTVNATQVSSNAEPQENPVETSSEVVLETSKSEGALDDTAKEEKTDKEEETSLTVNAAQVSSQVSPEAAEKIVEEVDDKKESSISNVIEAESNEAADIIKSPEQASIDEEAKTDLNEEREIYVPAAVEEKVAVDVAANDDVDKKEPEAPNNAVPESSQEEVVESKKVEEQNEAKAATTEAAESVKVDKVVDDKKEEKTETKVEEISRAINEPVRETLASKFEEESVEPGADKVEKEQTVEPEKTEVQATKENDATKTSKDLPKETPAKPAQKQSNNIISKVKQSLVKAKKAITGKSPSSKNLSSEPKGDIKVK